jgi:enolase-phosphatase E1
VSVSLTAAGVGVVLLDIEGTTTPIEFVHEKLFSYARDRVRDFLQSAAADPDVDASLRGLRGEHRADAAGGHSPPEWRDVPPDAQLASAAAYVQWLIDRDRKSRWLKELQGRIWYEGYRTGALQGEVYPDVPGALARWSAAGVGAGIFSSGSVLAQKLLFAHSNVGDLTPFLRWHFDTAVGPKGEAASYRRIAEEISEPPGRILFVSDVTTELDAARAAAFQTLLCVRPGASPPATGHGYASVGNFDEIVA